MAHTPMSIPTSSPTTPTPDKQKLESLQELKRLKGFGSCHDTPSSKTASLPTPGMASVPLANSADVVDAQPLGDTPDDWPGQYSPYGLVPPGAPLMKDYDSFTEGTGVGSFDSIAAADTDEHGNPIYHLSKARLSLVPEHQDKDAYVLDWLRKLPDAQTIQPHQALLNVCGLIHPTPLPTLKRPRSMTEYEEYRPRRPRTRSCPSSRRSSIAPD